MLKADPFAKFKTALDQYAEAISQLLSLQSRAKREAHYREHSPTFEDKSLADFDAQFNFAKDDARRAWNILLPFKDDVARAIHFVSPNPVVKLFREFGPTAVFPNGEQQGMVMEYPAAYLGTLAAEIKSQLEDAAYRQVDHSGNAPPDPAGAVDDDSHLPPKKLAELFHVQQSALESRLQRWRKTAGSGWMENPDRTARAAQYLYRVGSIRQILVDMKTTGERRAKKN